jgi:CRISPR system Cascade subunit CasE
MALIRGELVVGDPDSFNAMLAGGIGRHVAFGYGMVLLSPP